MYALKVEEVPKYCLMIYNAQILLAQKYALSAMAKADTAHHHRPTLAYAIPAAAMER